jgi:hypothetical protein
MKNKIVGICICMLMFASVLSVAAPVNKKETTTPSFRSSGVEWNKTYGGPNYDELRCVQETKDGGYIVCGRSTISNYRDPWVMKLDGAGNEQWNWTLETFTYNQVEYEIIDSYVTYIQQISDGGYLVALENLEFNLNTSQLWFGGIAKLSATGTQEWLQLYSVGFTWAFYPAGIVNEEDGYMLAGYSGDPNATATECAAALLKTDFNGVEQWHKEYRPSSGFNYIYAVCATSDHGYFLAGNTNPTTTTADYLMIKTDANGTEQWNKTIDKTAYDASNIKNCYETADGGYIMAGYVYPSSSNSDIWIVKTDSSGNMDWNKTISKNTKRDTMWSFEQTSDAGYVICQTSNYSSASGDKEDIFLVKIDENGNTKWVQYFGGPGSQTGIWVNQTRDGGFIVAGRTGVYPVATSDGLLVKFAPINITVTIKGGFGISTEVKNNGIANLTNVSWEIQVKGGILGHINKTLSGYMNITAGETKTVGTGMLFGFGALTITAKVADEEKTANGIQIIIFSLVKK